VTYPCEGEAAPVVLAACAIGTSANRKTRASDRDSAILSFKDVG
jgi:hypothetical protein